MLSRRRLLQLTAGVALGTVVGTSAACGRPDDEAGPGATVPAPRAVSRTSWTTDPWALGCYSFLPVGATPELRAALAAPVGDRLWFAGEAVSASAPATVHGALAAGEAAAAEAIEVGDEDETVVIVGAGIAGAAAARALADAGRTVIVLEARERTGGRLATVRTDAWPIPVEHGASWVHDRDGSDLAERLEALDVAAAPFAYDATVLGLDGAAVSDAEEVAATIDEAVAEAIAWAEDRDEDLSLAAALDGSGAAEAVEAEVLDHALRTEITAEYGADADELSAWWGTAEGSEGDDLLVVGGYGALVDDLLDGMDVTLDSPVTGISLETEEVIVRTDEGSITADRVIVTVPLGVLQAGTVELDPPLPPSHQEAIDGLAFGALDKVWLRWDEPWWTDAHEQWTLVDPDVSFVEWFNLEPATGEAILLGLVGGSEARSWAERSDDEVVTAALATLQRFADAGW